MQKKPYLIGITGGSGSGHTVFLRALAAAFSNQELCIISQDDYYRPLTEQQKDENNIENFDIPSSINDEAFANDVKKLLNGESIQREEYMFNNDEAEPKILTFSPAPIIIVEGIFIFHFKKISELIDLKLFVDAREELKIIRRIKRDLIERNYPVDDVLYRYEHHVSPSFKKYIEPYRPEADIIINNHNNYQNAAQLVIGFIKNKINS